MQDLINACIDGEASARPDASSIVRTLQQLRSQPGVFGTRHRPPADTSTARHASACHAFHHEQTLAFVQAGKRTARASSLQQLRSLNGVFGTQYRPPESWGCPALPGEQSLRVIGCPARAALLAPCSNVAGHLGLQHRLLLPRSLLRVPSPSPLMLSKQSAGMLKAVGQPNQRSTARMLQAQCPCRLSVASSLPARVRQASARLMQTTSGEACFVSAACQPVPCSWLR